MSCDRTEMCELLVGLPGIIVRAVVDEGATTALQIEIETRVVMPVGCASCGVPARMRARPTVMLVDLPAFGRPARLRWVKRRWECPDPLCGAGTWTELEPRIAATRLSMTPRAGKWTTVTASSRGVSSPIRLGTSTSGMSTTREASIPGCRTTW